MAKRKGLELDVLIDFTIDTNGRVKNIHFTKGSKVNYFKNTVRNAMAKWRFLPAQLNGEPVESQMSKIFSFSLLK
jgi:TonB family protein